MKWLFIMMSVVFGAGMLAVAVAAYSESQCKQECSRTDRPILDCQTLCR